VRPGRSANHIMSIDEINELIRAESAVMLYFKNDSCGPCQVLRPKIEMLVQGSFPKMKFVTLDPVKNPLLSSEFMVFAHPTILVFFEGKEFLRRSKYVSVEELSDEISRIYLIVFQSFLKRSLNNFNFIVKLPTIS
jgi:thioredoxin 1